jgi:hypothetical protein
VICGAGGKIPVFLLNHIFIAVERGERVQMLQVRIAT